MRPRSGKMIMTAWKRTLVGSILLNSGLGKKCEEEEGGGIGGGGVLRGGGLLPLIRLMMSLDFKNFFFFGRIGLIRLRMTTSLAYKSYMISPHTTSVNSGLVLRANTIFPKGEVGLKIIYGKSPT